MAGRCALAGCRTRVLAFGLTPEHPPKVRMKPTLLYRILAPFVWPIAANEGQCLALFSVATGPNLWVLDATAGRIIRGTHVPEATLWTALYDLEDAGLTRFLYGDEWTAWMRRIPDVRSRSGQPSRRDASR